MLKQKKYIMDSLFQLKNIYQLKFLLKFPEVMNIGTDGKFSDYVVKIRWWLRTNRLLFVCFRVQIIWLLAKYYTN